MKSTHDYSHDLYTGPEYERFPYGPYQYESLTSRVYQSDNVMQVCDFNNADMDQEQIDRVGTLMAAAPELYAACKEAIQAITAMATERCECEDRAGHDYDVTCVWHQLQEQMRDALKKAEATP